MYRAAVKVLAFGIGLAVVMAIAGRVTTFTSGVETVRIEDRCDQATFDAAIGPGTCVGDGNVTFDQFLEEVAKDGGHGAWRFHPDEFHVEEGEGINSLNIGGETHTFTPVAAFGGGFVQFLNNLSGAGAQVPECRFPAVAGTFVPSGANSPTVPLAAGTHRFQCCIHPWMRTELTVRED